MRALKPIHGNRVVSVEEAMRRIESVARKEVVFHDHPLVKSEYLALESMADQYFDKSAKEYFWNFTIIYDIYLHVKDRHITHLVMNRQDLNEIPRQMLSFSRLNHLSLEYNDISRIENVPPSLSHLHISSNKITEVQRMNPHIKYLDIQDNPIEYSDETLLEINRLRKSGVRVLR